MKSADLRKRKINMNVGSGRGRVGDPDILSGERRQIDNLNYIYSMLLELCQIAKATKEEALVYYLEMSAMEASDICDAIEMRKDADSDN